MASNVIGEYVRYWYDAENCIRCLYYKGKSAIRKVGCRYDICFRNSIGRDAIINSGVGVVKERNIAYGAR